MSNRILKGLLPLMIFLSVPFSGMAAEVSQGKCVSIDKEKKLITLEEYDTRFDQTNPYGHSTGITSVYNVARAVIGLKPEPGDILRIAYEIRGEERIALKVMNVTKQDLRK